MIKRTLYFGNPAYLSQKNEQLVIKLPEVESNGSLPLPFKEQNIKTIPMEDIGLVVIDHKQITITSSLLASLSANNCAVVICGNDHHPLSVLQHLDGHTLQSERVRYQLEATEALRKNLWQQTVVSKIRNQASLLRTIGIKVDNMEYWARSVKSGDLDNYEARAASFYWANLFVNIKDFKRGREEDPPNNMLNYGYAILRAMTSRALVSSGLFLLPGIHHKNKYNAFCLADDIMEPYRPFVDKLVVSIIGNTISMDLTKEIKSELLKIPTLDVLISGNKRPLMLALTETTASLVRCYSGEIRKINYPILPM